MPPNTPTKRNYVRIIPKESPPPSLWSSISKLRIDDSDSETSSLTGSDTAIKPPKPPLHNPAPTTPTIQLQLPHVSTQETEAKSFPLIHHTPLFHLLDTSYTGFKILTPECPVEENGLNISLYDDYANTSSYYSMPILEFQSTASSPYDEPQNLSPYYRVPLFEEPLSTSYDEDRYRYLRSLDNLPFKQVSDTKEDRDEDSEDEKWGVKKKKGEKIEERLMPMGLRAMSPWESLLLYLWSRGFSEEFIGTELGNMETELIGGVEARRYVRSAKQGQWVYVPPHWKLCDEKAREVIELLMEEPEAWEEGSEKGVWLLKRWRGRGVEKMVRGLVEGYLWWRIKGVWEESK